MHRILKNIKKSSIFTSVVSVVAVAALSVTYVSVVKAFAMTSSDENELPIVVVAEPITEEDLAQLEVIKADTKEFHSISYDAGVASILNGNASDELIFAIEEGIEANKNKVNYLDGYEEPQYIRCTGYCDYGYTKSGEYVRDGIVAGKLEWLGKTCVIYEVAEDGSCGELIGEYEFLDTGYGINGSLVKGTSIDVWHPSEDAVWDWMKTYGDYVYIQIVDTSTM